MSENGDDMKYEMTQERWQSILAFLKEDFKHPEKTPSNILLLSLSKEELPKLFTRKRLELVECIKRREVTISQLAKITKRELSAVDRDLKILEGLGILTLKKTGREVRPAIDKEVLILPLMVPKRLEHVSAKC
jgi:predicted transcriptional regulator